MYLSPIRDRKEYDYKLLAEFVGCEVEFKTTSNEHLFGMLNYHNPESGTYTFTNLRKIDGNHWSVRQIYTYADFVGKFIATAKKEVRPSARQLAAEKDLEANLIDKSTILVKTDDTDVSRILDNEQMDTIVNPDIKDLIYESIEFSFNVDQEEFESIVSNEVTRITSTTDPLLKDKLKLLSTRQLVSLVVLPFSTDNRNDPIEFIIFGCDQGTFIFTVNEQMMVMFKEILESEEICKVLHDSCITSARLYHLFNIDMNNVDDTLVLDTHFSMGHTKHRTVIREARSYASCVHHYLQIKLPWAQYDNFYKRCGKGKLIATELDDTGRGYARSLAILLPEMRLEALKHIVYPLIQKNFCYSNCIKFASAAEYHDLRSNNMITPYNLINPDWGNPESMDMSATATVADLLMKKFRFFNRIKKPMTRDSCTQTEPMEKFSRLTIPSYKRALGTFYPSSRSSTVSPCDSSDESHTNHNNNKSDSSYYTQVESSPDKQNGQSMTNGKTKQLLRLDLNHPQLSENTNRDIDWDSIPKISSSESWGIKPPKLYPAGSNY